MPATSGKQYRFMQMIAHGKKRTHKGLGPSVEQAKEFIHATSPDKRKEWSKK